MAEAEEPPDTTTPPHFTSTPALSASTQWTTLAETPVAFLAVDGAVMEGEAAVVCEENWHRLRI